MRVCVFAARLFLPPVYLPSAEGRPCARRVSLCVNVRVRLHVCACVCVRVCVRVRVHTCVCACMCTCVGVVGCVRNCFAWVRFRKGVGMVTSMLRMRAPAAAAFRK